PPSAPGAAMGDRPPARSRELQSGPSEPRQRGLRDCPSTLLPPLLRTATHGDLGDRGAAVDGADLETDVTRGRGADAGDLHPARGSCSGHLHLDRGISRLFEEVSCKELRSPYLYSFCWSLATRTRARVLREN